MVAWAAAAAPAGAQALGPSSGGLVALDQSLRFLGYHKRVLMIGAHPDDEDTALLTLLARGMGAETAYLSLTRGEGGQNLIGAELGPALGVLRTGELLAARQLDGARQYFTRAYDFGFSKSLTDTWRFWPRDSVLKDVVRIIRRFRPQVVTSVFSGTPRDGHGQHQAAGWAAREAFAAAGDPARFPELEREEGLKPWRPFKLYQNARGEPPSLVLEGGVLDRAVGQSYFQIAMRGRSLHRSQDMGVPQPIGPFPVRLTLVEDLTGGGGSGFFAGIDTTLAGGLGLAGAEDQPVADSLAAALRRITPLDPSALPELRRRLVGLLGDRTQWTIAAEDQVRRLDQAIAGASGLLCDATTSSQQVVTGGSLTVVVACWNASSEPIPVASRLRYGSADTLVRRQEPLPPGQLRADTLALRLPDDFAPTTPYYLRQPVNGAMYTWPADQRALWGEPFEPPPLVAEFGNGEWSVQREVQFRYVDQALGEIRRPVFVVPRVEVTVEPAAGLWASSRSQTRSLTVRLRHLAGDSTVGEVSLHAPEGWTVDPPQPFRLGGSASGTFTFTVVPAGSQTRAVFRAEARDSAGRRYAASVTQVDYPHIHARQLAYDAEARMVLADIRVPARAAVGYVRGAADRIPEALGTLGMRLVLLGPDSLARGNLSRYQSIVIGPRAYETEPALEEHNGRLLEYVRQGGTLVVQYQQQAYFRGNFAPYPISLTEKLGDTPARVAAARVSEEDAAVRLLQPGHPVFTSPNRLADADWNGWVQERGLYFARAWDPQWTPLLEMADTGEPPQRGALLTARLGQGTYTYTGISFFRQLPAAVPGATRLFMNLIGLR
jgi:LmbE family N-acetylglucosaminyl deacetylase